MPIPAFVLGETGRVSQSNGLADKMFGNAMTGRNYLTVVRQPRIVETIEACARMDHPKDCVFETTGNQGEQRFKVTATQFEEAGQHWILVCIEDVSHLHTAGRMRRDFVANVSHELRTPLTAVIGFIETIKGAARDDKAARNRFIDLMLSEALRMDRLVGDLLALSRVEATARMRPNELVNITNVLKSSLSSLRHVIEKSGVTVTLKPDDDLPAIPGDEDQLRQIFNNMIENAVKYGGAGGSVEITVSGPIRDLQLRGDVLRVSVQDHGKGIAAHHLPRLTERFYRVDTHRSREMGGTGLGLAIVKHILSRHRGRLEINSKVDVGTEVIAVLPIE